MPESVEVTLARIEERQKNQDEKLDAMAENHKELFKVVEEFHTFKGQVKVWGSVVVLGITLLKDAAMNFLTGNK